MRNNFDSRCREFPNVSLSQVVNLENDSSSSQNSLEDVPDLLNCSYETLKKYAGFSGHDRFIYGDD